MSAPGPEVDGQAEDEDVCPDCGAEWAWSDDGIRYCSASCHWERLGIS